MTTVITTLAEAAELADQLEETSSRVRFFLSALEALTSNPHVVPDIPMRDAAQNLISHAEQDFKAIEAFRARIWRHGKDEPE